MRQDNPEWDAAMQARDGLAITFMRTPKAASPSSPPEVTSFEIDRQLSGDVPDGVRLVGGSSTATGKVVFDALAKGAPNVLDAAELIEWIGSATQVSVGFGGHALPVHTGAVRSLSASDAQRSITVELLDGSDALRSTVTLPAFGSIAKRWMPGRRWRYPVNASAVVVAALHACGVRITPLPRPEAVASIPMVFGPVPDFGWLVPNSAGMADDDPAAGADGIWGPVAAATEAEMTLAVHPNTHVAFGTDCTYFAVDCWVEVGPAWYEAVRITFGGYVTAMIQPGPSAIQLQTTESGEGGWTIRGTVAAATGWHHVRLTGRKSVGVTMNVDSATVAASYSIDIAAYLGPTDVRLANPCYVQAVQVLASQAAISADWAGDAAFTPQADISTSALDLDYLPTVSGAVAWTLIKEIAAAEFGMAGFDESGRFRYHTRAEVNATTSPVMDFSPDVLPDVQGSAAVDSVRTALETSVRVRALIESGAGHETEAGTAVPVAVADAVWSLPPGWSSHEIHASNPWHGVDEEISGIITPGMAWDVPTGLVACQYADGTGLVVSGDVSGFLVMTGPTSALMWIRNHSASYRYAVWPASWTEEADGELPYGFAPGGPAVWVNGRSLSGDDPETPTTIEYAGGITLWGRRTLDLDATDWRQGNFRLYDLGLNILHDLVKPRLALADIAIPGDPRLELGDVVRILGQARFADIHARIARIKHTAGVDLPDQGLTTTLGFRVIDPQMYAPAVSDVYPDAGPSAGGTVVTVSGTHLTGVTAVRFGGALATNLAVTDTAITCTTPANNARDVQVTVGSAGGLATWAHPWRVGGTPTPHDPPTVTVHPESGDDIEVTEGDDFGLHSTASGTAPLSVQWQRRWSLDGLTWSGWSDAPGDFLLWANPDGTSSSEFVESVGSATGYFTHGTSDEYWQFRAAWTNAYGTTYSDPSFRVLTPSPYAAPTITTQPRSSEGITYQYEDFSFTSAASGSPTPTVQWQRRWSLDRITWSSWADISGATNGTLTQTAWMTYGYFTHSGQTDGATEYWQFRAVWTNTYGQAYSDPGPQRLIWYID